jgi:hypothetical protein
MSYDRMPRATTSSPMITKDIAGRGRRPDVVLVEFLPAIAIGIPPRALEWPSTVDKYC